MSSGCVQASTDGGWRWYRGSVFISDGYHWLYLQDGVPFIAFVKTVPSRKKGKPKQVFLSPVINFVGSMKRFMKLGGWISQELNIPKPPAPTKP